jgi:hypothetical protein
MKAKPSQRRIQVARWATNASAAWEGLQQVGRASGKGGWLVSGRWKAAMAPAA